MIFDYEMLEPRCRRLFEIHQHVDEEDDNIRVKILDLTGGMPDHLKPGTINLHRGIHHKQN